MVWLGKPHLDRDSYSVSCLEGNSLTSYDLRTRQLHEIGIFESENGPNPTHYARNNGRIVVSGRPRHLLSDKQASTSSIHVLNGSATEFTASFKQAVIGVRVHAHFICVVFETCILILSAVDFSLVRKQETFSNQVGCCDFSTDTTRPVMSCPGLQRGTLRIQRLWLPDSSSVVAAHESGLAAIGMSGNGAYVSSVSETGSLIRVHSTMDSCDLLYEVRRSGIITPPPVQHLFMSPSGSFIGTVDEGGSIISLFRTSVAAKDHLLDSASQRADNNQGSIFQTISSVYKKCVDVLPGSAAWAVVKVPKMNSKILTVTAQFGPDPYTLVAAAQTTAGVAAFIFRFDPDESGTVTLARCETLGQNLKDESEDGMIVSKDEASTEGTAEDWVFLEPADSQLDTRISW